MGKISYINASPVYYGLDHGLLPDWLTLHPDVPSELNRRIIGGEIPLSPISAAFYAMHHKELLILPGLSISCNGRVMSVILASHYPIKQLNDKTVLFSRESASAAAFLKMIFHQQKIHANYLTGQINTPAEIANKVDAALIIGDNTLIHPWQENFAHVIDLGQLWYEMTKLPFVFALWVVQKDFAKTNPTIVKKIHELLLQSKDMGYQHINKIIKITSQKIQLDQKIVKEYFELLFCDLDEKKIEAMKVFFDYLYEEEIFREKANIQFFRGSEITDTGSL
ncbi:MAG: menaquinone biosynthesis protein [Desulfobacula sp.]|nr:menaquinone biosynthesis protein [Desulfobacula sp.]